MNRLSWIVVVGAVSWLVASGCSGKAVVDNGNGGAATTSGSGANNTTGSGTTGSTSSGGNGFDSCNGPGQCDLTYKGCCGGCGVPQLGDLQAVALDQLDAFHQNQCPNPEPCPGCASCDNGEVFAYCDAGHCAGASLDDFDLRTCNGSADLGCAGALAATNSAAASPTAGSPRSTTAPRPRWPRWCAIPTAPPPPPCVPTYPPDAVASCNAGRCEVDYVDF